MRGFFRSYWQTMLAIVKDRNVLLLIFIGPIVYSIYYPFPYSPEQVREIPVAIVDLDHTSLSRELVRLAQASPDIKVIGLMDDVSSLEKALRDGDIDGGMIIPDDFNRNIKRGQLTKTVVLGNGAYFMLNRGGLLGFSGAVQALSSKLEIAHERGFTGSSAQEKERREPVQLELSAASNPSGGYSTYVVPGVAIIVLQQTLLLGLCMLLGSWRASGAPYDMTLFQNRLALLFAGTTICCLNTFYYIGIVYWVQDYPHMGKLEDLMAVSIIFSFTATAWAIVIGSFMRYKVQPIIHLIPTSIPIIFLAGFAWPVESIPAPLVILSKLIPSTAGVQAFINVDQMGASFAQVLPEVLSMLLLLSASLLFITFKQSWPKLAEKLR
ncbi:ABC transporter permease [Colwellia sp. Arc7-635]|uniref:ABC transporter permease n=1 Tax=Colwellia sp. Arc7-635 TaxID=2497879 RepID=UPI000F854C7C|nr:ABC transporter permease [Colwellia sp. Arc7-635]AZQ84383.1 ABC transporter permease [Colwellia sp. Arc7-635]